jgi:hypothetical protein
MSYADDDDIVMIEFGHDRIPWMIGTGKDHGWYYAQYSETERCLVWHCFGFGGKEPLQNPKHPWWAAPGHEPENADPGRCLKSIPKRWRHPFADGLEIDDISKVDASDMDDHLSET